MLPVKDVEGKLYGYLGRNILDSSDCPTDTPKYLFPKNLPKSRFLFGSAEILAGTFGQAPLKRVFLVESPFCVMKFASLGIAALTPFGWSVSTEQLAILATLARGVVFLPDRNKAEEAARIVPALAQQIWLRFPPLPAGCEDPENLSLDEIQRL